MTPFKGGVFLCFFLFILQFSGYTQIDRPLFRAKNYGGTGQDNIARVLYTPDGGRIICGTTNSNNNDVSGLHGTANDIWVAKINNTGAIEWQKTYGATLTEDGMNMIATSDGGYAILGTVGMFTSTADPIVIKITSNGTIEWQKQFGGASADRAWGIAETTDNGFVVTGETIGTPAGDFAGLVNKGQYDVFVSKLSSTGTLLWSKIMGGTLRERGNFVKQLSDGNLLLGAYAESDNGDVTGNHNNYDAFDAWIIKLNPLGDVIWKKCFGGLGSEMMYNGLEKNNRYYMVGTTMNLSHAASGDVTGVIDGYDMWYIVVDTAGTLVHQKCIGGTSSVDNGQDIVTTLDGKFMIGGYTQSNDVYVSGNKGLTDYALIKIDSAGTLQWSKLFGTAGYDNASCVSANADSSFSIGGAVTQTGGDVASLYGGSDIWLVNYADTSLYPDLYVKITGSATMYVGNKINYKLNFGRNTTPLAADTSVLYFVKDPRLQLLSATRPVTYTSGDTLFWKLHRSAIQNRDSLQLKFNLDNSVAFTPDSVKAKAAFTPFNTEFFQLNNFDSHTGYVRYQNGAITNPLVDIASSSGTVATGARVNYTLQYSFLSALDTTQGIVKMIKDPKTDFVSSSPLYNSISGDTLTWNWKTSAQNGFSRFHFITLQVKDTPLVQAGNLLKFYATLQFNTIDTTILKRTDSLQQLVNAVCRAQSFVNNTLPYPQGLQWQRTFGGSAEDYAYAAVAVSDTSFVLAGDSKSFDGDLTGSPPNSNIFAVKYLNDGALLWKTIIGGEGNDYSNTAVKDDNGGVIIAGTTNSVTGAFSTNHGGNDIVLTRLDSAGNIIWQKLYGGTRNETRPVIRKATGNTYVVFGNTSSVNGNVLNPYTDTLKVYPWLFAINETGNLLWQQVYADSLFTNTTEAQPTLDGGFVLAGDKSEFDAEFNFTPALGRLVKTNSTGAISFIKNYKNRKHSQYINAVIPNADSSFTFAGYLLPGPGVTDTGCLGDHGKRDTWVVKADKNGNTIWQKFYGGTGNDEALNIIAANGGGYLVTGTADASDGNVTGVHNVATFKTDAWLVRLNEAGDLLWQKTIGGNDHEKALSAIQLPNNDFIVAGQAASYNNGDVYNSKGSVDGLLFKIGASNYIRGYLFADLNGNGLKEFTEPYFNEGAVESEKNGDLRSSDVSGGFYANSTDTGTYITKPVIIRPYYASFPASDTTTFTGYLQADTINFAMRPIPNINDLKISMFPLTAARPGFPAKYKIIYENAGTATMPNGYVQLIKDSRVAYDSASVTASLVVADTLRWSFTNLLPLQVKEFTVYLKPGVPPTLTNSDTLHFTATVNPIAGDTTAVNNVTLLNQLVTGSFDPNDKTEIHGNSFPAQLLANGAYLTYIIRFQNTGNDTAFRVLVRDTLEDKLDWNSLEMISASHSYQLTVAAGNKLEWKFDPIILPDSGHNLQASQGYIVYRIKPRSTLAEGDTIKNRASIYFDFNLPIITNDQRTVIDNGIHLCPGSNIRYESGFPGAQAYQWQVNTGSGYNNITDGSIYTGAHAQTLQLISPPTAYTGYTYRCLVTNADGTIAGIEYTLRFRVVWSGALNSNWETPGNWNCGILPDEHTDVLVNTGTINVNAAAAVRSLTLKPGVQVTLLPGVVFTVKH